MGNPLKKALWVFMGYILLYMGYNPQESLENTLNTMGTLLGVHPSLSLEGDLFLHPPMPTYPKK